MKKFLSLFLVLMLVLPVCAFADTTDAVTAASLHYYQSSSLDAEVLADAIAHSMGTCTVATVNVDGSPLIVGGSPAMLDLTHIAFGWNNNVTMANMLRTGKAMMCYYLFDAEGATKADRHQGARLVLEVETDEAVISDLRSRYPSLPPYATILKIVELLPLG